MTMTSVTGSHAASRADWMRAIGLGLFGLVSVFYVAFGALYAGVHDMLFFHAAAVPEAVRHDVKPLYLALMKLIGGACIALGVLGAYVTFGPVREGRRFAASVLTVVFCAPVAMAAYVAEMLARTTGAPTSWHLMGIILGVVAVGYALTMLSSRR